jgi:hypothetical protein
LRTLALDALFVQAQAAILPDPVASPKPLPQKNRRKTLALGFTAMRSSLRLKSSARGVPVAKLAQRNLLRQLGIIDDEDDVSQEEINDSIQLFRQQLPPSAIAGLRAMFRMDCVRTQAVEDALIRFGGQEALEIVAQEDADHA